MIYYDSVVAGMVVIFVAISYAVVNENFFEVGGVRLPLNGRSGHPTWSLSEYEFFISGSVTDCGFWFLYILFYFIRTCLFFVLFLFVLF